MRLRWVILGGLVSVLAVGFVVGSRSRSAGESATLPGFPTAAPLEEAPKPPELGPDPRDYLPMTPGTRWVYDLVGGSADSRQMWDILWPTADGKVCGRTNHVTVGSTGRKGTLILQAKEPGLPPGGLDPVPYDAGVLLEVVEDDFLCYRFSESVRGKPTLIEATAVYWALREKPLRWEEVVVFDKALAPPEAAAGSVARQARVLMVRPGAVANLRLPPSQVWLFDQTTDRVVPGYEGKPCLHFLRAFGDPERPLFTEDLWFAPGTGLVRRVQTVDGVTTLTQTLREKTP